MSCNYGIDLWNSIIDCWNSMSFIEFHNCTNLWNSINQFLYSINDSWNSINTIYSWHSINDLRNSINHLWNSINAYFRALRLAIDL